ncbi:sigma-54 dependent transcriptional regulator [uncultured Neptuniibacter sp.]|uniref:sigma-54-dependent transcriptional regulator n=1 Tax=uncultured Neptuniibacter sp. TaxID=502143 RepID=UPI00262793F3|nr:sigma-54 dependent transcriptional regulator [uncultured Neptuniibacter sp.]
MAVPTVNRILLIEDDVSMAAVYRSYLTGLAYQIHHEETGQGALTALDRESFDGILLDLTLPDMNGLEILEKVNREEMQVEVIVTTGDCSMTTAIEAMQLGARDYLVKPFSKDRLLTTLNNTFENQKLKRIVETYREEIDRHNFCGFIGSSLPMQRVYQVIDSAASSKATIFITGESGTGKEVCAEAVHQRSERNGAPFIALNCGAIPKDLIESEIFGHVKGSFTGAVKDRDGAASAAQGGTLFLDEICEMELALQSKLLRFLQTGTLQKVGSDKTEKVDVRIICASNKDPLAEVQAGNFREDLYYRLHVLPIHLPPLRERENDVVEIARNFLQQYAKEEGKDFNGFDLDCELILGNYDWPGNVRQLQNVIRNIVVLHNGEWVTQNMLPAPLDNFSQPANVTTSMATSAQVQQPVTPSPTASATMGNQLSQIIRPMAEVEREMIERAIDLCGGNIPTAAHYLQISAATIYRKRNSWKEQQD